MKCKRKKTINILISLLLVGIKIRCFPCRGVTTFSPHKKGCLGTVLNYIRWWVSNSGALWGVEYPFIVITPKSMSDCTFSVRSMGQMDLLANYLWVRSSDVIFKVLSCGLEESEIEILPRYYVFLPILSRYLSQSFFDPGRSSKLHLVSV